MDPATMWHCDPYILQCCFYLSSVTHIGDTGFVEIFRNTKKVLEVIVGKSIDGSKHLTTNYQQGPPQTFGQIRSRRYSMSEWKDILNRKTNIKWFDNHNHIVTDPVMVPYPCVNTWRRNHFASASYQFLKGILCNNECGLIKVTINGLVTYETSFVKDYSTAGI
jgi:hypothetical protein